MKRNETIDGVIHYLLSNDANKITKAMAHIWGLLAVNFDFGISPLVGLREVMPEFEWAYARTEPSNEEQLQGMEVEPPLKLVEKSQFMWDVQHGVVFARLKQGKTEKKYSFGASLTLTEHDWCSPHFNRYIHLCVRDDAMTVDSGRLSEEGARAVEGALLFH